MVGLAEALARSRLTAAQRSVVDDLLASAGRLDRLVSDLLNFNALEPGQVEIARRVFRPEAAVRAAAGPFQAAAAAKGLTLELKVGAGANAEALGDPDRLEEALSQLISNAVKFTVSGGVTVSVARVGEAWRFRVADTGVGFDPADAERLFGGFELGDASPTREHTGAGLGLAICRRLASLMGGQIEAKG